MNHACQDRLPRAAVADDLFLQDFSRVHGIFRGDHCTCDAGTWGNPAVSGPSRVCAFRQFSLAVNMLQPAACGTAPAVGDLILKESR